MEAMSKDYEQERPDAHDVSFFVSYCIEAYMRAHGLSARQAVEVLMRYGVLDCLAEFYEVETTRMWPECFVADMDEMVESGITQEHAAVSR